MPGSQASASQEQGSAQVQAALAELEWAQVLESQAEPESLESVPELDLLAGMDSQVGQVTQAALVEAEQGSVQAARVAQALGSQGSQVPEWARAGPESQERESAEKAASAQERESARQEQQESQAGPDPPQSSAHTHAQSQHT